MSDKAVETGGESVGNCSHFRGCESIECIFFSGTAPCWNRVSPFKLRRRPSTLLRQTAEHCECLHIPCQDCNNFEG